MAKSVLSRWLFLLFVFGIIFLSFNPSFVSADEDGVEVDDEEDVDSTKEDKEDEDEFEIMLDDPTSGVEGARLNTDLYEAYVNSGIPRRRSESASPPAGGDASPSATLPPLRNSPPPPALLSRSGPWGMPSGSSVTSSSRPLRRTIRSSRAVNFNDFTSRRRSAIRESLGSHAEGNESSSEGRENWSRRSQPIRRFFPFSRTRRHESTGPPPSWVEIADAMPPQNDAGDDSGAYEPVIPWYSFTPFSLPSPPHTSRSPFDTEISDERVHYPAPLPLPRLRRGGLRAPESLFSRSRRGSFTHAPTPPPAPLSIPLPSASRSPVSDATEASEIVREVAAYPTPESGENENLFLE